MAAPHSPSPAPGNRLLAGLLRREYRRLLPNLEGRRSTSSSSNTGGKRAPALARRLLAFSLYLAIGMIDDHLVMPLIKRKYHV